MFTGVITNHKMSREIYLIFISISLGYFVQDYKGPWEANMIGFDVFMHKLADLAELQHSSKWLWLCYELTSPSAWFH